MKKKIFVAMLLSAITIVPAVANALSDPTTSPLPSLYEAHVVNIKDKTSDPVGKIVKYDPEINVKPLIAERTAQYRKSLSQETSTVKNKTADEYFSRIASGLEEKYTTKFFDILKENDLVYFEPGSSGVQIMSNPSDVTITKPFITYHAGNDTWQIYGGFNWNNGNWVSDGHSGPNKHIGGYDGIGIALNGGTNGALMVDQYLSGFYKIAPGSCYTGFDGTQSFLNPNRDGNVASSDGVAFKEQDAFVTFSCTGGSAEHNRFGAASVSMTYSSAFASATGTMKTNFNHTWNTAEISSMEYSWPLGIKINATPTAYQFGTLASSDAAY